MNKYNEKLLQQGRKRRAKLLRESAKKTPNELAAIYQVSASRIRWMLSKAIKERS